MAVIVLIVGFVGGFFTAVLSRNRALSSFEWAVQTIRNNYYEDISEEDILNLSLKEVAERLLDPYSEYYTKEEYEEVLSSNSGSRSGIGVSYSYVDADFGTGVYVVSVVGNSPAYQCGLRAGTFIFGASYLPENQTESQTVSFTSSTDFSSFVGARETGERFTLITDRGEFSLTKEDYTASYCFMSTNAKAWDCVYTDGELEIKETSNTEKVVSYLPDGAAYLSLSQFYGNAAEEMAQLIGRFNAEGCTSLILDLRNNGGGYVEVMQYISSLFTTNRPEASSVAMSAKFKDGSETVYKVKNFASSDCVLSADVQIYVLANNATASASEALIGVLVSCGAVDYCDIYLSEFSEEYLEFSGTAEKNCRTYGKGIMQSPFTNYLTGEVLKLTVAKIYWPNGNCIHDRGITVADGCNTVYAEWSATYGDNELVAAVSKIYG